MAAANPGGVFISSDAGLHWTAVGPTFPVWALTGNVAGKLCTIDIDGEMYISGDGGHSWSARQAVPPLPASPQCVAMAGDGTIYCGTQAGAQRLVGAVWMPAGLGVAVVSSMCVTDSGALLAAGNFLGVVRSADRGQTWSSPGTPSATIFSITEGPQHDLFASSSAGVWHSTDSGATWTLQSDVTWAYRLATVPGRAGPEVFAVRGNGIFRYSYDDQHWHAADGGSAQESIVQIAGRGDGSIFAATSSSGVLIGTRP